MKVLLVLALVVFSGCDANVLWQQPPKTNLEVVKDAFWDYVAKATFTAGDALTQMRESQLGQDVNTRISQSADTVNQYIVALRTQAAPLTQDFMAQLTREADQLKARLENDLTAVGTKMQPYADELVASLQARVEELKKDASPYATAMDPEALKALLVQKTQELKEQLAKSASELQAQTLPFTEEMRQKVEQSLEEFQSSVIPAAQSFETQLTQKTQEVQQSLAPYGEELRTKLDASAQDLQAQLSVLWQAFTEKNQ